MRRIVIGGIPAPIGGVTTFLRRLLHRDCDEIDYLLDIYPGEKEPVRGDCAQKVIPLGSKTNLLKWLWTHREAQRGREIFYNFSRPRGLLLPLLAPKLRDTSWALMLHHGTLESGGVLSRLHYRASLSRFDEIRSLSPDQSAFYRNLGVPEKKIMPASSYCEPADHADDPDALAKLAEIRGEYRKVIIMSGFPRSLYNFELGIDAMSATNRTDCALCIFIYGPGELRERLNDLAAELPWLKVFDGKAERYFSTFLRHSDLLLRLTTTESVGITVWDADYWGRNIIASDACKRPTEANTVPVDQSMLKSVQEALSRWMF